MRKWGTLFRKNKEEEIIRTWYFSLLCFIFTNSAVDNTVTGLDVERQTDFPKLGVVRRLRFNFWLCQQQCDPN